MKKRLLAVTAVALLGGIVALIPRQPAPFSFNWPAGTVYTYQVSLTVNGTVGLGHPDGADAAKPPLEAELDLEGTLELRSYGRKDGNFVLGARLARLKRIDWTLAEHPLVDDERSIVGSEIPLVVAPDGTFHGLQVAKDDYYRLTNLLRQLLAPMEVIVASEERSWTREQTNPAGDVIAAYEVESDGDLLALLRRPLRYTRLTASAVLGDNGTEPSGAFAIQLDRNGHLASIKGEEQISVQQSRDPRSGGGFRQKTQIAVELLSITKFDPTPASTRLDGLSATHLDEVSASPDAERLLLEQRSAGLTMDQLLADLRLHGLVPKFPHAGKWMWRATGLLRLHPERCRDLVDLFKSSEMTRRSRGRILDLLVGTGTPEAQDVLRELLETDEAKGSDRYELLLQRLSLLEEPTPATVGYLRAKVEENDYRMAAANSLGSAIGRRMDGQVDEHSAEILRNGLAASSTAKEKVGWLGAMGNAGVEQDVVLLERYAADSDPSVRAAAADALRKVQTDASERILLKMTGDADSRVMNRVMNSLSEYTLEPRHFDELRMQVVTGRLQPASFSLLMNLLEHNRSQPMAVRPVLEAMLAQNISDRRLLLRVRELYRNR